jgi:hypothetical protein
LCIFSTEYLPCRKINEVFLCIYTPLQVLKLEFALEEEETARQHIQRALAKAVAERDSAAPGPLGAGATGIPAGLQPLTIPGRHLSIFDTQEDGWASTPTQETLLPKIVALWDELYVPLVYRSRFFLAFRGREVFYYEVEHRRLEWKRAAMQRHANNEADYDMESIPGTPNTRVGTPSRASTSGAWGNTHRRNKQLDKAAR